jgi:hypothetical protein
VAPGSLVSFAMSLSLDSSLASVISLFDSLVTIPWIYSLNVVLSASGISGIITFFVRCSCSVWTKAFTSALVEANWVEVLLVLGLMSVGGAVLRGSLVGILGSFVGGAMVTCWNYLLELLLILLFYCSSTVVVESVVVCVVSSRFST